MESRRKHPILTDPKASKIVQSIDWDFRRFDQRRRTVSCALRTAMLDQWTAKFLRRYPEGTVVELGAGFNTRFERLDNGRLHWFHLDLPDAVEVRRKFFSDSERRRTLAGSVLDTGWRTRCARGPDRIFSSPKQCSFT